MSDLKEVSTTLFRFRPKLIIILSLPHVFGGKGHTFKIVATLASLCKCVIKKNTRSNVQATAPLFGGNKPLWYMCHSV